MREAPERAERHATLGQVYAANGQWAEAQACFENVIKMAPDHLMASYYLAISAFALGDREATKARLLDVLEKDPTFAPAYYRLGAIHLEDDAIDEAEDDFRKAIEHAPLEPAGYIGMGDVMIRKHEYARAAGLLEKAIGLKTTDQTAHYLLGLAYRGLGRVEDAKRNLARGSGARRRFMPDAWTIEIDNHRRGVAYQLAKAGWYVRNGRPEIAIELLEVALRWHPESVEILNNLAIAHLAAKQLYRARALLIRAESLGDNAMATSINFAAYYLEVGDLVQAEKYANRAVELGPGVAQALVTKSNVLIRQERLAEAVDVLEKAIRLDDSDPAVHFDLGNLYMRFGRVEEAKEAFATAAEKNPRLLMAHLRLCDACLRLGARDDALKALANAKRIAPGHPLVTKMIDRLEERP